MAREPAWVALLVAGALGLASCDAFFGVQGRVTHCDDATPIVGARVTLGLTAGVSSHETSIGYTDPDGAYDVALNEPPDAAATMVVEKPGYATITRDFPEAPDAAVDLCLTIAE